MKRSAILTCVLLFAAIACPGQDDQPATMRGIKRGEPKPSVTTLFVGANEVAGSIAETGWPIIVSAAMDDGSPVPVGIGVRVTDDNGNEFAIAFERVKDSWIAAESASASLAPGQYHIALVPAGDLRIESGDLRVVEAASGRGTLLGLLRIQRALLLGKDDDALAEADHLTTDNPMSQDAWIARGDILMSQDKPDEALQSYDKADALHTPEDGENLPLMQRRRDAFLASLAKRGVIPPSDTK
jgi:hypothetical protein